MKNAKEVRRMQKERMRNNPRYKELEDEIGVLIDTAILENKDKVTIKLKSDELPTALLLVVNYGYGWQYFPSLSKLAPVSFGITC